VITPKAIKLQEKHNKYTFMVNKNVNKNQIKYALETLFKIKVTKIQTLNYIGKKKRKNISSKFGYTNDWKKAIVKLKRDQKITIDNNELTLIR
jgi:large subunit ribosomal protein L23